jgi:putative transposase
MPRTSSKSTRPTDPSAGPKVSIPSEFLDQVVKGPMSPADVHELCLSLKKAIIERAMGAEMSHHLGYRAGEPRPAGQNNHRNGTTAKTVLTHDGPVRVEIPRDREASFEPILIPKHERRFNGFDDKIIALYARGMTVREIQGFLAEQYGTDVSADLISAVTDEVMAEVTAWQSRPLEAMYPVVFFDALRVKIRENAAVHNRAVYLALGVRADGTRDVLGIWIEQSEGAKFWLKVFNDLKTRGVHDILIAVVDGLKGLPDAIEAVFPRTTVQTCIVHLIRNSLSLASWKDRKSLAAVLRPIYSAPSIEAAEAALKTFEASDWARKYPTIAPSWRRAWQHVIPLFSFPPKIRRMIYTTNAIESLNMKVRKIIKTRGHFPSDAAALKLIWLAVRNAMARKTGKPIDWREAASQFVIIYGERFTEARN